MTQPVVTQMRQVYSRNIFIRKSYCSKMLVFIKAFTYSFSALNQVGPGVDPASKVGGEISALFGSQQRWDRIRVT